MVLSEINAGIELVVGLTLLICIFIPLCLVILVTVNWQVLFHKRKIVEVTHADGTTDYTVKVNGLLGLPFLYRTEVVDYGLYECRMVGMSLDDAKNYVGKKEEEYNCILGIRVIGRKEIYRK